MFLPGLGYPMRGPKTTDKEWDAILQAHQRSEMVGGWVAAIMLIVGAAGFMAFWILYAIYIGGR